MTDLHRDLLDVIEHAITHSPRSLQTKIGPSEIGTPCDRCLGHKLAGTAQLPGPVPWLGPHAYAEEARMRENERRGTRPQPAPATAAAGVEQPELWGAS